MRRLFELASHSWLVIALMLSPLLLATDVRAGDQDEKDEKVSPEANPDFADPKVDGIIYGIRDHDGVKVLTVYDLGVGLGIDVYVKAPGLIALVTNGTACVGRYVVATGVRTGPLTLDAEGLQVDLTKACGQPPQ